jgi:hypothetical protein
MSNTATLSAAPDLDTLYTGEEGHQHADCAHCGADIFLDQEFDYNSEAMIPPDDQAYWQHNDERYRPGLLSWCRP